MSSTLEDERARMVAFYRQQDVAVGWGRDRQGRYHARYAQIAWEAWQQACGTTETASPQAPIVRIHVHNNAISAAKFYAPSLPDGEHDLYCVPDAIAPMMRDGNAVEAPVPIAWVPIHPRTGPLWANVITSLDAERPSYPLMPLYGAPEKASANSTWTDKQGRLHTCDRFDLSTACEACDGTAQKTNEPLKQWNAEMDRWEERGGERPNDPDPRPRPHSPSCASLRDDAVYPCDCGSAQHNDAIAAALPVPRTEEPR